LHYYLCEYHHYRRSDHILRNKKSTWLY
jgi:hypothetical protein